LFFTTDPVALDHVGWEIIDAKRAEMGWRPVASMGLLQQTPAVKLSARLSALAASGGPESAALAVSGQNMQDGWASESFDRRQPEHVILAASLGLGVFDASQIEHRQIVLKA
jgi:hypothetical protein